MESVRDNGYDDAHSLVSKLQAMDGSKILKDEAVRNETLSLARKLVATLEGPVNRATDLAFRPYISIAARIAVDLDLFKCISASNGATTSEQLASASGGDRVLISRVLRLLAAVDFVEQPGRDLWSSNEATKAMASAPIAAGHRFVFDVLINSAIKAPKFLRETGYKAPSEPTDGFVQYANQTKYNIFEFLQSMPSLFQDFNLFMGNTMGAREYWHEWYDVRGRLLSGFEASKCLTLLVDIGGGKGHDLLAFESTFSQPPERYDWKLVLQDLPQVLDHVADDDLGANIVKMPHDFFSEQPIRGARGYFLHHILHDWSDNYCHLILKNIRASMSPGYSKLLIHELILPDIGATEIQARFDLVMMTFNGGMERSRTQWTKLLQEAGFTNIKLWEHYDHDGIIEAEIDTSI